MNQIKQYFSQEVAQKKLQELLGSRASSFATSVLQVVASNKLLANAEPQSVFTAACMAATLDLPINSNLGFAYILPYNDKDRGQVAQFQLGYKGFIQLAQRSGQFKTISTAPIFKGQIKSSNPLTGYEFDFEASTKGELVGYAAYFSTINGFEKTLYMTVEELKSHGGKYSQTFKKGFGLWKDNFDAMAQKTVLKLLLSKFAPLSIDMQKAVISDQSVIKEIKEDDTIDVEYVDNQTESIEDINNSKEKERIKEFIESCKTTKDLSTVRDAAIKHGLKEEYSAKSTELNGK